MKNEKFKIAILDDYQQLALEIADWSTIKELTEVTVFSDHISEEQALIARLLPFDVICIMRERTPITRTILNQLPQLKLIVSTGLRNLSLDEKTAEELGITIKHTSYTDSGAAEMTWALLMAISRNIPLENQNLKNGRWQTTIGMDLTKKTIGIIGLGGIGSKIARYAKAFNMKVIAWSANLTAERAEEGGAQLVSKEELFRLSDFISIHLVLSDRSRGIVGKNDLKLMKPTAYFINTSRGPLVDEPAMIEILQERKIAGAALDVFDIEPLPEDHPYRRLDNMLATPHIGYVTRDTYQLFYDDTVSHILEWLHEMQRIQ